MSLLFMYYYHPFFACIRRPLVHCIWSGIVHSIRERKKWSTHLNKTFFQFYKSKNHFPYCISCVFCSNMSKATAASPSPLPLKNIDRKTHTFELSSRREIQTTTHSKNVELKIGNRMRIEYLISSVLFL